MALDTRDALIHEGMVLEERARGKIYSINKKVKDGSKIEPSPYGYQGRQWRGAEGTIASPDFGRIEGAAGWAPYPSFWKLLMPLVIHVE